MLFIEIYKKIKFCMYADRIGPDVPFTHWMLHFNSTMNKLCKKKFMKFGNNSEFRAGAYAVQCSKISIGNNVVIRPNAVIMPDDYASISIEDDVMIGMGVHIYVNNHKFDNINIPIIEQGYYPSEGVIIKSGSWIGANAIILPGVTIGKNSVVGAGSIVTKNIPDFSVAAGNPARIIKTIK
jgi:acetyltransferase-like isoleucine patch superfamily enzyme